MNSEKGQALPMVLLAVGIGTLLITPFLGHAGNNLIGSRVYGQVIKEQYSSDAGVEHAIWRLTDDGLDTQLSSPGDSVTYQLGETVNGIAPNITVTRDMVTIAWDDFESVSASGGEGWLGNWNYSGDVNIVSYGSPYQGNYHLELRGSTGYVERAVDLSSHSGARLQFWAKARSFEGGEEAHCLISPNGTDWTPVKTWVNGEDDDTYYFYDIDLSSYTLSSEFWIAFDADMSASGDQLYVDDLKVVRFFTGSTQGLPSDDFESGDWSGGSGWLYDWYHLGDSSVRTDGTPYEGNYHLRMRRNNSYVDRAADLSGQSELRLQFWAKVYGFEGNDQMQCLVSPDDYNWTPVMTWTTADSDNTYHFFDIDLSPYTMSSEFWVAFMSGMNNRNDYFYVDYLKITGSPVYEIASTAGDDTIRAVVRITGGTVSILSWEVE